VKGRRVQQRSYGCLTWTRNPSCPITSARQMLDLALAAHESAYNDEQSAPSSAFAGGARGPTYNRATVQEGLKIVDAMNHISPRAIGKSLTAWHSVPDCLTPALFEAIASKRQDPAYATSHDRRVIGKGSGLGHGV
jgi:hypothetical protein